MCLGDFLCSVPSRLDLQEPKSRADFLRCVYTHHLYSLTTPPLSLHVNAPALDNRKDNTFTYENIKRKSNINNACIKCENK